MRKLLYKRSLRGVFCCVGCLFFLLSASISSSSDALTPVTLRLAMKDPGEGFRNALQGIARRYEQKSERRMGTPIKIEMQFVDPQREDRLYGLINRLDVDLVVLSTDYSARKLIEKKIFASLSDVVSKNQLLFANDYGDLLSDGDRFYGLPLFVGNVTGFYYWKDVFKQYGVKVPRSWADFLAVGQKLYDGGIIPLGFMSGDEALSDYLSYFNLRLSGKQFYWLFAQGHIPFKDARFKDGVVYLRDLIQSNLIQRDYDRYSDAEVRGLFLDKKVAMILDKTGYYDLGRNGEIGFFPFPHIEMGTMDNRDVVGDLESIHLLGESPHQREGKDFLAYLYVQMKKYKKATDYKYFVGNIGSASWSSKEKTTLKHMHQYINSFYKTMDPLDRTPFFYIIKKATTGDDKDEIEEKLNELSRRFLRPN